MKRLSLALALSLFSSAAFAACPSSAPGTGAIPYWGASTGLVRLECLTATTGVLKTNVGAAPTIIASTAFGESVLTAADAAAVRGLLGLGSAAVTNTGTSGATIPLLNGTNSWSGVNTFANTTDSSSTTTGSLLTSGGLGVAKSAFFGNFINIVTQSSGQGLTVDNGGTTTLSPALRLASGGVMGVTIGYVRTAGDFIAASAVGDVFLGGTSGTQNFIFATSGFRRLQIDTSGNTIPGIDATYSLGTASFKWTTTHTGTVNLTGGQIAFPSTQNPSSNVNTLDDYKEGTWTPVLSFATPGNLSVAYTTQFGSYTKIGKMVFASWNINTSSFTHTTASGLVTISGLPYTSENITGQSYNGVLAWSGVTKTNYTNLNAFLNFNAATMNVIASGSGQAIAFVSATDMPTGGSVILTGSIAYLATN